MTINLNSTVLIRLNEGGKKTYRQWAVKYGVPIEKYRRVMETGEWRGQLWDAFGLFGPLLQHPTMDPAINQWIEVLDAPVQVTGEESAQ